MMLLFLIMRCMPTRELIVATPLPLSSQPATSLSALAPAQRAGAQRLCAMAPKAKWLGGPLKSAVAANRTCLPQSSIGAFDPKATTGAWEPLGIDNQLPPRNH
jgi:hypothetical protein